MADFYCPLDEFEFEYKGRWVSCIPAGGAIASVSGQARPSKPIWDGLELMVALQKLFPAVAIIVVSGKGPELLAAAMDKGALAAFSKPVDPQELLEAIAQATTE